MSSTFQGPLESVDEVNFDSSVAESADSKVDESVEGFYNDESGSPEIGKYTNSKISQNTGFPRTGRVGSLARFGASSSHLPNLEAHQHSTLFSLSLIEGRCRTRATHLLNEGRHPADHLSEDHPEVYALARQLFAEMSKELHKAGILPDEFAGQDLEDLRGQYLNAFDAVLHNIAANGTNGIPDRSTSGSIHGSDVFDSGELSSPSAMEQIIKRKNLPGHQQSLLSSLMLRSSVGEPLHTSIFQTQYGTKSLLGKGGFGQVFSVKNLVDDREYAIKRIVIRGKKLNLAGNKEKQQALLMEARSLSKLNHPNIVRYYGAWVETCPAGIVMDGDTSSADISE
jgi:translation initiation factor 2-alpha kinase 3